MTTIKKLMCMWCIATYTNKALVTKPWWCNIRHIMADCHCVVPDKYIWRRGNTTVTLS